MTDFNNLYDFFEIVGKLKATYRFSEVPAMANKESSADHSWRLGLMGFILAEELELDIDICHAIKIALVHDLAESIVGDVDIRLIFENKVHKDKKLEDELQAMKKICSNLSEKQSKLIMDLWNEYEEGVSREAKFIKALDKIEGLTYLSEVGRDGFDNAELIGLYGNKEAKNFPEIIPFFRTLKKKLRKLCIDKGYEWKKEYDL